MRLKLTILLLNLFSVILATRPITYVYKTVDNLQILLDVYVPSKSSFSKYPVIFATHGGGYLLGTKSGAFSEQELNEILRRGWVAVSIDYRLSPGVFLDQIIEDCQDTYNWVRTELIKYVPIDPDRIAVFGGSAGGGLAVLNGYKLSPRPKAVISFYPFCTNFTDPYSYVPNTPVDESLVAQADKLRQNISEYEVTGADDPRFALFFAALTQGKAGWLFTTKNPNESPSQILSKLRELSAVENIDSNYPPTYLIHGLKDSLVPYSQSVQMADRLKKFNIIHKIDLVPDAEHGFDLQKVTTKMWKNHILPIFDFIQEHMVGYLEDKKIEV